MCVNSTLKIMQWNCNSIRNKIQEFRYVLSISNIDIVCLSETKLDHNYNLQVDRYKVYRSDRTSKGGGVALLIKSTISHEVLNKPNTSSIESIGIKVYTSVGVVNVVSCYKSPSRKLDVNDLKCLTRNCNFILTGDFNARQVSWLSPNNNNAGNIVRDFCITHNYFPIIPNECTHYSQKPNIKPSTLDISIVKNINYVNKTTVLQHFSTEHRPVLTEFDFQVTINKIPKNWDFTNADWDKFQIFLDNNIDECQVEMESKRQVDEWVLKLETLIKRAMSAAIPYKAQTQKSHIPVPKEILGIIKLKNRYRRKYQRTRDLKYRKIQNYLAKLTERFLIINKNKVFNKKLNKIRNPRNLWNIKKMLGKKDNNIPPLVYNNCQETTDKGKAEVLAKQFELVHLANKDLGSKSFENKVKREVKTYLLRNPRCAGEFEPTSSDEVNNILRSLKNNKAPGFDKLPNVCLKNLGIRAITLLVSLINSILKISYFPHHWKTAKVIPIHKPGKPSNLPSSYRPISLLSSLSKVCEKIILIRMRDFISSNNLMMPEQFGFRGEHSTTAQICRVTDDIIDGFNRKKHTGMVLYDVEKAFDSVWITGLLYKLIKINFPLYLILILKSYLENRAFRTYVNSHMSTLKKIGAGIVQGSLIGPVIFLLYINDMPKIKDMKRAVYADDTAYYATSWRIDTICNRLVNSANILNKYFRKWKLKLNASKTEIILFTRRRPIVPTDLPIMGGNITWSKSVKYLGVHLDSKLTYCIHTSKVKDKFFNSFRLLYPIFNRKSHLSEKNKLLLYKSCLRPILTYACPVYYNMADCHHKKLQILQNICLRIVGNHRMFTPLKFIHEKHQMLELKAFMQNLCIKFYLKLEKSNNVCLLDLKNYNQDIPKTYRKYVYKRLRHYYS